MNASPSEGASWLDELEAEAAFVMREIAAERERPALLFSGGKDSAVLLHVALKAFAPEPLPFPLLHIDTGQNFPEVLAFRDRTARETGAPLVVGSVEDSIAAGTVEVEGPLAPRNAAQSVTLGEAIAAHGFDALFGGARRDEEKARAKERVVSLRDGFGGWNPKAQRPELWRLYNARIRRASTCASFLCRTGPRRTCGPMSRAKAWSCPRFTSRTSATWCGATDSCGR